MRLYQCKIIVKNSKPPVWWRCLIPADISFSALSIILDEITGSKCGADFSFDMLRTARIWEPTQENPLRADYYHSAYHAARTALSAVFPQGKTINYHCGGQVFRIEIEKYEDGLNYPILILLKVPWHVNGLALANRLDRAINISKENGKSFLSRDELEKASAGGVFRIGLIKTDLDDEQTCKPSAGMMIRKIADALMEKDKPAKEQPGGLYSMNALLECYTKEDLRGMAHDQGLPFSSANTKKELAQKISEFLLNPETIRRYFSLLDDREIEVFEKVLENSGLTLIPPEEEDDFYTLRDIGYVFIGEDLMTDIPKELHDLYPKICDNAFHERRHKLLWIRKCLNHIIPPYYAIIPMKKLCRICRRTSDPVIQADEVPDLVRAIPEDDCECVVRGDMVYSRQLIDDPETLEYVKKVQGDKSYYIMRETEIEELLEYGYPPKDASYRRFKDYLVKTLKMEPEKVEKITGHLHESMAFSYQTQKWFDILSSYDIKLTKQQVMDITPLLQDMSNHTPTFYNRGCPPFKM